MDRETHTVLAVLLATALAAGLPAQDRPPNKREAQKLVAEYLALDERVKDQRQRQLEILTRLEAYPPLDSRAVKDWRKQIAKAQRKGRRLEKGGDNWFWETKGRGFVSERGRYIVGGETGRPKGLMIGMHGGGAGSGDAGSAAGAYRTAAKKLGWVAVFPEVLEKTEHGWTDAGSEEFVLDLVDAALRTWKLDPDRVYFAGHSMGGYGSWTLGAHHADRVAAIAPSAGAPTPLLRKGGKIFGIIEGVIPNLRNVFTACYQSTDDPRVPPGPNQMAIKLLKEAGQKWEGYEHDYWEVSGRGHGMAEGGALAHLQRIADRVRVTTPERIVWQPAVRWKRQFYWLHWEYTYLDAIVVADLDRQANAISIECDQATRGMSVLLDERLVDLDKEVVVTVNGEETFRGIAQPSVTALLISGAHPDEKLQFVARVPAETQVKKGSAPK